MKRVRFATLIIASVALVLSTAPVASSSELSDSVDSVEDARAVWSDRYPNVDFDDQVAYHRHFRSQFDFLDESDTAIGAVMAAEPTNESFSRWGLQMTDAEFTEMERRDAMQRELPDIAAAVVGEDWSEELLEDLDPDGSFGAFAGRWIDQHDGGRLKIAVVPTHDDYTTAMSRAGQVVDDKMAEGLLTSSDVEFVEVEFTADEIYGVNRDFGDAYLFGEIDRLEVGMAASMNPVDNRVDLYAEPAWLSEAKEFIARYPEGLVSLVEVDEGYLSGIDAATEPRDDRGAGNWHAGAAIKIRDGNNVTVQACGWGATARTSTYVYMVTAGHCLFPGYGQGSPPAWGWYNYQVTNTARRGAITYSGSDWITVTHGGFVYVYHGVRGDLARLSITQPWNMNDYDCFLENEVLCGRRISRREYTTETEIGDVKCSPFSKQEVYRCATLNSNDAPLSGYDYLRSVNTTSSTKAVDGDSGAGWKESTLLTGILKGRFGSPSHDTYFTHAYYIEASGYLAATKVCGTSGLCNN